MSVLSVNNLYTLHEEQQFGDRAPSDFARQISSNQVGVPYFFEDFIHGAGGLESHIGNTAHTVGGGYGSSDAEGVCVLKVGLGDTSVGIGTGIGDKGQLLKLDRKTAFEVRFKKDSVSADTGSLFLGLSAHGAKANVEAATHEIDTDSVGVWIQGSTITGRRRGTGSAANVGTIGTLSVDEYTKLGFVYDPAAAPAKRVKFYLNGVEDDSYISATQAETASGFPADSVYLDLAIALTGDDGSDRRAMIDWVLVAQEG